MGLEHVEGEMTHPDVASQIFLVIRHIVDVVEVDGNNLWEYFTLGYAYKTRLSC